MAYSKGENPNGNRIHSSVREHTRTVKTEKFAKLPPSLNRINKQLP
ncbi:hypothetical protein [Paenibacillus sp. sgz302251]